jgi:hypothetical protein
MDDRGEMRIVEIVEMCGETRGERGKMHVHAFRAARHRRVARRRDRARRVSSTPGWRDAPIDVPITLMRERCASRATFAAAGAAQGHGDRAQRRRRSHSLGQFLQTDAVGARPSAPTITTMTNIADEISTNTAGTPECLSSAATQKPTKIELSRLQLKTKPTARAKRVGYSSA